MEKILCEHPIMIVNSDFMRVVCRTRLYWMHGAERRLSKSVAYSYSLDFPKHIFNPKRNKVTIDNADDCYTIDEFGEIVPMYRLVRCGKCLLCRDQSASQWAFRCECEAAASSSESLFVTLTYNPKYRPAFGLNKRDVQLFLKRLRKKFASDGIDHNLRYLLVGEYGSNTHLPHYHIQFFNFPRTQAFLRTLPQVNSYIASAWHMGFTYTLPIRKGGVGYVLKYMRKPQTYDPKNEAAPFLLASKRNGGIGIKWVNDNKAFYRANPHITHGSVTSVITGKVITQPLTNFAKRHIFPCLSLVCPKHYKDIYKEFVRVLTLKSALANYFSVSKLRDTEVDIINKFSYLGITPYLDCTIDDVRSMRHYKFGTLCTLFGFLEKRLDDLINNLYFVDLEIDTDYISKMDDYKLALNKQYSEHFNEITQDDIDKMIYEITRHYEKQSQNDYF